MGKLGIGEEEEEKEGGLMCWFHLGFGFFGCLPGPAKLRLLLLPTYLSIYIQTGTTFIVKFCTPTNPASSRYTTTPASVE